MLFKSLAIREKISILSENKLRLREIEVVVQQSKRKK